CPWAASRPRPRQPCPPLRAALAAARWARPGPGPSTPPPPPDSPHPPRPPARTRLPQDRLPGRGASGKPDKALGGRRRAGAVGSWGSRWSASSPDLQNWVSLVKEGKPCEGDAKNPIFPPPGQYGRKLGGLPREIGGGPVYGEFRGQSL